MLTGSTRRVEIPHEPGEWLELRTLSGRQLEAARQIKLSELARKAREVGFEVKDMLQTASPDEIKAAREATADADPLTAFDRWSLLQAGIAGWSYADAVTPENIDRLDEQTVEWAALELVRPALPRSDEEQLERFLGSTKRSAVSTVR